MSSLRLRKNGFTLIEILLTVAIIAILGGLATIVYRGYVKEAATTELTDRIVMIQEQVRAEAAVHGIDLCAAPSTDLVKANLDDPFVQMSVVQHDLHYAKPLALHVRADGAVGNPMIARELFKSMQGDSHLGPNPVVTDSAVSFTVFLTAEPCVATKPATPLATKPAPNPCPSGQSAYTVFVSSFSGPKATYCLDTCNGVVDETGRCCAKKDITGGRWCSSGSYTTSKRHSRL